MCTCIFTYVHSLKEIHQNWSEDQKKKKSNEKTPKKTKPKPTKGQALFLLSNNANTRLAAKMCREEPSRFTTHSSLAVQTNTEVKLVFIKTNGL